MGWIKIGESTASGMVDVAACYTSHMPHVVTVPGALGDDRHNAIVAWCTEEFGTRGLHRLVRCGDDRYRFDVMFPEFAQWTQQFRWFYFQNPDHAVIFRMVWG